MTPRQIEIANARAALSRWQDRLLHLQSAGGTERQISFAVSRIAGAVRRLARVLRP